MKRLRRRVAAVAFLLLSIPIVAFMPWSGSNADTPSGEGQAVKAAEIDTPFPLLTPADRLSKEAHTGYTLNAAEIEALARMLYGEARGITSDMEKAACVWCVLNRVDDPAFPDTVLEVLEAPRQFSGYSADYPVLPELEALAADVLTRYHAEQDGDTDAGRVLPADYLFFTGDGKHNYFTAEWKSNTTYQWELNNPYED